MVMAFCLEHEHRLDGKVEMTLAGSVNLEPDLAPPQPMLIAACILKIPGFDVDVSEFLDVVQ
jgi:hypothetical protein